MFSPWVVMPLIWKPRFQLRMVNCGFDGFRMHRATYMRSTWDGEVGILVDEALGTAQIVGQSLRCPPIGGVSSSVILATWNAKQSSTKNIFKTIYWKPSQPTLVVESVCDLVTDHRADSSVIHGPRWWKTLCTGTGSKSFITSGLTGVGQVRRKEAVEYQQGTLQRETNIHFHKTESKCLWSVKVNTKALLMEFSCGS